MSGAIGMEPALYLGVGLERGMVPKVGSIPGESACVFNPVARRTSPVSGAVRNETICNIMFGSRQLIQPSLSIVVP